MEKEYVRDYREYARNMRDCMELKDQLMSITAVV